MGELTEISDAELEASEKYLGLLIDAEWIPRDVDESGNCWEWELRARNTRLIVGPAEHAFLAGIAKSASDVIAALRSTRERLAASEEVAEADRWYEMNPTDRRAHGRLLLARQNWDALAHPTTEETTE